MSTTHQTIEWDSTPPEVHGGAVSVVMLTVLYHPDLERVGERAALPQLDAGREAPLSRDQPLFEQPAGGKRRALADACLSRTPITIAPWRDGARLERGESRTKVMTAGELTEGPVTWSGEALRRGVVLRLGGQIVLLLHRVEITDVRPAEAHGILGESPAIHRVHREIRRVADLGTPALVRGETGTGKDLVARAIHAASGRRGGPFVAVNLAAVPPALAAAELFGVERGAFTGAFRERPGFFAQAHGGTLFLDEIGDAPSDVQVMLLRAIETGEVQGVGAGKTQKVNVRLLAATDADLEARVRDGAFRGPLLHRLSAHEIWIRPLRERRDDIGRLLLHFLREELMAVGALHRLDAVPPGGKPWLPASLVARLAELSWAGNVRQLRNVAGQLVSGSVDAPRVEIGASLERLLDAAAPPPPSSPQPPPPSLPPAAGKARGDRRKPADIDDEELLAALRDNRWELEAAAAQLGIPRPSLYMLIRRNGRVRTAGDLTADEITTSHRASGGDIARMVDALQVSEPALRRRIRELGLRL
jgi:DNA-binding NtrC family response regulator